MFQDQIFEEAKKTQIDNQGEPQLSFNCTSSSSSYQPTDEQYDFIYTQDKGYAQADSYFPPDANNLSGDNNPSNRGSWNENNLLKYLSSFQMQEIREQPTSEMEPTSPIATELPTTINMW